MALSLSTRRRTRLAAVVGAVALAASLIAAPAHAATGLTVIDLAPNAGPRGAAFTPDGSLLFIANQDSDTVSVINTISNTQILSIPVGDAPVNLAVSPDGSLVYVVASGDDNINVIDVDTLSVVGSPIALTGTYQFNVVFAPDGTIAYVAGYGSGVINRIDVATATEIDAIPGPPFPQGLAITADGSKLWIVANAALQYMDTATLAFSSPIDVPPYQIRFMAMSPDESEIVMGGDGTTDVYFVDTATETIVNTVAIGQIGYGYACSPDGSRVFVGGGVSGTIEINTATHTNLGTIPTGAETNSVVVSPSGDFGYALSGQNDTVTVFGDGVRRVFGASRYETAIAVSKQAFPAGASTVLIATGVNYPDALAAGPAAAALNAPLLLTAPGSLPTSVRNEIIRLAPDRIIVVGGTGAVTTAVFNALVPLATTVERISGADRYATARKITEEAFGPGGGPQVYIATGRNFPDALSASAVGAALSRPVLLVNGSAASVDVATLSTLSGLGATTVFIAGGTGVVSSGIKTQLENIGYTVTRLGGANRYETSLLINSEGYPTTAVRALIATGVNFPDALAGSAWAGKVHAPLFIVPGTCIPQGIIDKLQSLGAIQANLIGGTGVLTSGVFNGAAC